MFIHREMNDVFYISGSLALLLALQVQQDIEG